MKPAPDVISEMKRRAARRQQSPTANSPPRRRTSREFGSRESVPPSQGTSRRDPVPTAGSPPAHEEDLRVYTSVFTSPTLLEICMRLLERCTIWDNYQCRDEASEKARKIIVNCAKQLEPLREDLNRVYEEFVRLGKCPSPGASTGPEKTGEQDMPEPEFHPTLPDDIDMAKGGVQELLSAGRKSANAKTKSPEFSGDEKLAEYLDTPIRGGKAEFTVLSPNIDTQEQGTEGRKADPQYLRDARFWPVGPPDAQPYRLLASSERAPFVHSGDGHAASQQAVDGRAKTKHSGDGHAPSKFSGDGHVKSKRNGDGNAKRRHSGDGHPQSQQLDVSSPRHAHTADINLQKYILKHKKGSGSSGSSSAGSILQRSSPLRSSAIAALSRRPVRSILKNASPPTPEHSSEPIPIAAKAVTSRLADRPTSARLPGISQSVAPKLDPAQAGLSAATRVRDRKPPPDGLVPIVIDDSPEMSPRGSVEDGFADRSGNGSRDGSEGMKDALEPYKLLTQPVEKDWERKMAEFDPTIVSDETKILRRLRPLTEPTCSVEIESEERSLPSSEAGEAVAPEKVYSRGRQGHEKSRKRVCKVLREIFDRAIKNNKAVYAQLKSRPDGDFFYGYYFHVEHPIWLDVIDQKITDCVYDSLGALKADIDLLVHNWEHYIAAESARVINEEPGHSQRRIWMESGRSHAQAKLTFARQAKLGIDVISDQYVAAGDIDPGAPGETSRGWISD